MKLDVRLDRMKTWWSHKVNKEPTNLFYPDIYDLTDHAFHIVQKILKNSSGGIEQIFRVLQQEGSMEFSGIFEEARDKVLNSKLKAEDAHEKEKSMPFACNWRSWGEALILKEPTEESQEFFKSARHNGFYIEEDWGYITLRKKPIDQCFSRTQLNNFYKLRVNNLGEPLINE